MASLQPGCDWALLVPGELCRASIASADQSSPFGCTLNCLIKGSGFLFQELGAALNKTGTALYRHSPEKAQQMLQQLQLIKCTREPRTTQAKHVSLLQLLTLPQPHDWLQVTNALCHLVKTQARCMLASWL